MINLSGDKLVINVFSSTRLKMDQCVNLRPGEAKGVFEDPISHEEVQEGNLVSFVVGGQRFCYDALTLLRYIDHLQRNQQPIQLPERIPLSAEQVQQLYTTSRGIFPQVFVVVDGDRTTPYVFKSQEAAIAFVTQRQRGAVYQLAQVEDPPVAELLYPNGMQDVVPVFALRDFAMGDELPNGAPELRQEPALRNVVYERMAPGSPLRPVRVPVVAPGAPQRPPAVGLPPREHRIQGPNGRLLARGRGNEWTCYSLDENLGQEVPCPPNVAQQIAEQARGRRLQF